MNACASFLKSYLLTPIFAVFVLLALPTNFAAAQDRPAFTQQELDQILAPIALYPDALLSQIMMASTYPLEVIEAERWSVANPRLTGSKAVRAVERNNWDPSVKSLVAFPQILRMTSAKLDWTESMGDAFLGQEPQVMNTVQELRLRAYKTGNLRSNALTRIEYQGDYIVIDQADPLVAYVPYYNPTVVYGEWWWPQSPPVYWAPWPGYRERPGFGSGFAWGIGIALGAEFFYGAFDWRQHRTNVINVTNNYYPQNRRVANRAANAWQHDPVHRRGAPYRAPQVRSKFTQPGTPQVARSSFRGHQPSAAPATLGEHAGKPAMHTAPNKKEANGRGPAVVAAPQNHSAKPVVHDNRQEERSKPQVAVPATAASLSTAPDHNRKVPETSHVVPRARPDWPSPPVYANRPEKVQQAERSHALEDVGQAAAARNASQRGRDSRQAARPVTSAPPVTRPPVSSPAPRPSERVAKPFSPSPKPREAAAGRPPEKAHAPRAKVPEAK